MKTELMRSVMLAAVLAASGAVAAERDSSELVKLEGCCWVHASGNDGDSFRIRDRSGKEFVLRLYFADCPESSAGDATSARRVREQTAYFGLPSHADTVEFGRKAESFSRNFLGKNFTVYTAYAAAPGRSAEGRIYGFARSESGADLAEALVKAGLARAHGVRRASPEGVPRDEIAERLKDMELAAAMEGVGIWARSDPNRIVVLRAQIRAEEAVLAETREEASGGSNAQPVNVNTATAGELERIPGIGPALSKRIIDGRPYKQEEDLLRVQGIGEAKLESLRGLITFE